MYSWSLAVSLPGLGVAEEDRMPVVAWLVERGGSAAEQLTGQYNARTDPFRDMHVLRTRIADLQQRL